LTGLLLTQLGRMWLRQNWLELEQGSISDNTVESSYCFN
jgi:hypothetical protein